MDTLTRIEKKPTLLVEIPSSSGGMRYGTLSIEGKYVLFTKTFTVTRTSRGQRGSKRVATWAVSGTKEFGEWGLDVRPLLKKLGSEAAVIEYLLDNNMLYKVSRAETAIPIMALLDT